MPIRPARAQDAARCVQISAIRSEQALGELLDQPNVRWLVLEDDQERIVGLGIIHYWPWNKVAWVWDLTVEKQERGKGYGRALLAGMVGAARDMGARVLMDFGNSQPCDLCDLYTKNGFRVCGTNDRWFPDQKDTTAVFYSYDL